MAIKRAAKPAPNKPEIRPRDVNQLAHFLVKATTERDEAPRKAPTDSEIARVMRELGSRGGKVGGKNRMAALTEDERSDLASKAAHARWGKRKPKA